MNTTLSARLAAKTDQGMLPSGCWEWTGAKSNGSLRCHAFIVRPLDVKPAALLAPHAIYE